MTALDTTTEAAEAQTVIHRKLGPAERFRLAVEMSDAVFKLTRAGIRLRHPELTDEGVANALMIALHGILGKKR
jgi:hypothetical protein